MIPCTNLRYYDEVHKIYDSHANSYFFGFEFLRLSYGLPKSITCSAFLCFSSVRQLWPKPLNAFYEN